MVVLVFVFLVLVSWGGHPGCRMLDFEDLIWRSSRCHFCNIERDLDDNLVSGSSRSFSILWWMSWGERIRNLANTTSTSWTTSNDNTSKFAIIHLPYIFVTPTSINAYLSVNANNSSRRQGVLFTEQWRWWVLSEDRQECSSFVIDFTPFMTELWHHFGHRISGILY